MYNEKYKIGETIYFVNTNDDKETLDISSAIIRDIIVETGEVVIEFNPNWSPNSYSNVLDGPDYAYYGGPCLPDEYLIKDRVTYDFNNVTLDFDQIAKNPESLKDFIAWAIKAYPDYKFIGEVYNEQ